VNALANDRLFCEQADSASIWKANLVGKVMRGRIVAISIWHCCGVIKSESARPKCIQSINVPHIPSNVIMTA
jgi:hypothetical protein